MEARCHTFKLRITSAPFCWLKQIPKFADSKCLSIDGYEAKGGGERGGFALYVSFILIQQIVQFFEKFYEDS